MKQHIWLLKISYWKKEVRTKKNHLYEIFEKTYSIYGDRKHVSGCLEPEMLTLMHFFGWQRCFMSDYYGDYHAIYIFQNSLKYAYDMRVL